MADKKESVLTLNYTIPVDIFQSFSVINNTKKFEKRIKKTNFTGLIELIVAFLFTGWVVMTPNKNQFLVLFCVILLALGFYSFSYYRWIFPQIIARTAKEGYQKSEYLNNPVELEFFTTHVTERSLDIENIYKWNDIKRIVNLDYMVLLELENSRTMIIPKGELGDNVFMLVELLQTVAEKYSKKIETVY